jgi:arylsulfatase A-like enzyme
LQLFHVDWPHEPATPQVFAIRLLIPVALCIAALGVALRATTPGGPFQPISRAAGSLLLVAACWSGFWASLDSEISLSGLVGKAPATARATRPNIILVVLDTVRADHLDLFGYERETMPNLRRFAIEQCQSANRMLTTGPWTLPSHASMFTGLYPSAHRAHFPFVHDNDAKFLAYPMRDDVPTVAEFLGGLGYQTAGIAANFGILSQFGISRGFEHFDLTPGPAFFAPSVLWLYRARMGSSSPGEFLRDSIPAKMQTWSRMFSVREPEYRRAWEINSVARDWLQRNGSRPFFLFLNYFDAHEPYQPVPEDDERFAKRPSGDGWFRFPVERFTAAKKGKSDFSAEEVDFLRGQYDSELVSLDRELGKLFDFLGEAGFFDNTLIFITTDHGEAFFEHGFPVHGNSLYQPENGGFLLVKAPPSLGPIEVSPMMQFVDFFPTLAAVLNEPLPGDVQGSAWGSGRESALSEVFCKSCGHGTVDPGWPDALRRDLVSVMIGDQKLIRSTHGPDEVYDLAADPAELHPLADPDPEFMRRAEEVIAARNQRLVEGLSVDPNDPKLLERLRSLGYIQ